MLDVRKPKTSITSEDSIFVGALLRQEVAAFDTDLTHRQVISGITNHMGFIHETTGEKEAHLSANIHTREPAWSFLF